VGITCPQQPHFVRLEPETASLIVGNFAIAQNLQNRGKNKKHCHQHIMRIGKIPANSQQNLEKTAK
jgi:hypothetical protein